MDTEVKQRRTTLNYSQKLIVGKYLVDHFDRLREKTNKEIAGIVTAETCVFVTESNVARAKDATGLEWDFNRPPRGDNAALEIQKLYRENAYLAMVILSILDNLEMPVPDRIKLIVNRHGLI